MIRSLPRALLLFVLVVSSAACGASAGPPPTPANQPNAATPQPAADPTPDPAPAPAADPAPAPEPAPDSATEPEVAPAAPRVAPERWMHMETLDGDVPSANLDEAHALLDGRTPAREVIVAVIDGGVDTSHEDLDDVLWVNPGEVAGNGVDDDGNGYVDDVHGWNFIGGPSGQSVNHDTFEMTRIHAACTGGAAAGPMEAPEPDVCAEAAERFEAEREELTELVQQIGQIQQIWPIVIGILTGALGEEPTMENVSALQSFDPRTGEAKNIFLQLAAVGIDQELLDDQFEDVQTRLQYGLDPDFDPRPIVGDDYTDLSERIYGNADVAGPDPSHGTGVASVVAAERDNDVGVQGAADGVRIMAVRAVPNGDERDKDVANAIRYAVDNGAHIINMSFGKTFSPWKPAVDAAVQYADEAGVLMVHAAGNDGEDLADGYNFPNTIYADGSGSPSNWIEVGASGWQSRDSLAATFSNYGANEVDVFAPGVAIMLAAPGNEYGPQDGTSFAAPLVSGIAGLLMAYFPDLDAADVRRIILESATDAAQIEVVLPGLEGDDRVLFGQLSVTGGVVDAAEAVRRALAEERPASH